MSKPDETGDDRDDRDERGANGEHAPATPLTDQQRERLTQPGPWNQQARRRIGRYAADPALAAEIAPDTLTTNDFWAYLPQHAYIYVTTREVWPAASVNSKLQPVTVVSTHPDGSMEPIRVKANVWLDQNRSVEQMTWAPGEPEIIEGRYVNRGGWVERLGARTFNLYAPPTIKPGNANDAAPWLSLLSYLYPVDAEARHIEHWLAHRIQRPHEKVNHALVLGGEQRIGKDSLLVPVKYGVGPWNFEDISPSHLLGRFNGFIKSVVLRISEGHDLGEFNRYSFYERLKSYTASPPEVLRCDEKHIREHSVFNVCGVIITTNYKAGGLYLPPSDHRHFVAWSDCKESDQKPDYWRDLHHWFDKENGIAAVVAHLQQLDLSGFNAKAPPARTAAWWEIVDSNRAPEDAELSNALDRLDNPDAVTVAMVIAAINSLGPAHITDEEREFIAWLKDRKNSRLVPHRFEACGYVAVRNDNAPSSGRWKVDGRDMAIYAKVSLVPRDRIVAARHLAGWGTCA
jgi:hypothetical protein